MTKNKQLTPQLPFRPKKCLIIVCFGDSDPRRGGEQEQMAFISLNSNENIESALRRFKRKVISEEIIKDLKKHAHYIPPGQKAKLKSANARKRNRRRFRQMRPNNNNNMSSPNQQRPPMGQNNNPNNNNR